MCSLVLQLKDWNMVYFWVLAGTVSMTQWITWAVLFFALYIANVLGTQFKRNKSNANNCNSNFWGLLSGYIFWFWSWSSLYTYVCLSENPWTSYKELSSNTHLYVALYSKLYRIIEITFNNITFLVWNRQWMVLWSPYWTTC